MIRELNKGFANLQVQSRNMRIEVPHAMAGALPLVGSPLKIPTSPIQMHLPPPLIGQHTQELLEEMLGCNRESIESLNEDSVI
jgi:crotonobetainyl-CoA:carnitine CoA-transferase CaiB-like acyl-CoA transferase